MNCDDVSFFLGGDYDFGLSAKRCKCSLAEVEEIQSIALILRPLFAPSYGEGPIHSLMLDLTLSEKSIIIPNNCSSLLINLSR